MQLEPPRAGTGCGHPRCTSHPPGGYQLLGQHLDAFRAKRCQRLAITPWKRIALRHFKARPPRYRSLAAASACATNLLRCAKGGAGTGNPANRITRKTRFSGVPSRMSKPSGERRRRMCLRVTSSGGSRALACGSSGPFPHPSRPFRATASMRIGGAYG